MTAAACVQLCVHAAQHNCGYHKPSSPINDSFQTDAVCIDMPPTADVAAHALTAPPHGTVGHVVDDVTQQDDVIISKPACCDNKVVAIVTACGASKAAATPPPCCPDSDAVNTTMTSKAQHTEAQHESAAVLQIVVVSSDHDDDDNISAADAVCCGTQHAEHGGAQHAGDVTVCAVHSVTQTNGDAAAVERCGSVDSTACTEEGDCRICMVECDAAALRSGVALHLGCHCAGPLGIAHVACAEKWFKQRRSIVCEVCGHEAKNLPEPMRKEIMELFQEAQADPFLHVEFRNGIPFVRRIPRMGPRSHNPSILEYLLVCLLPALASGLFLGWFYSSVIHLDSVSTVVVAVLVSSVVMFHWAAFPHPVLHVLFTTCYFAGITSMTLIMRLVFNLKALVAAGFGGSAGILLGMVLFQLLLTPTQQLYRNCVMRRHSRRRRRGEPRHGNRQVVDSTTPARDGDSDGGASERAQDAAAVADELRSAQSQISEPAAVNSSTALVTAAVMPH